VEAGFARRSWKVGHIPASLPPSIAYGLLRTAGSRAGEVLLDPFCGAGTILVERGLLVPPAGRLVGSDVSITAREAAAANAAMVGVPIELHDWDATALPLAAASVDTIVTNPPYGQRYGEAAALPRLYGGFLAEAARVLRGHGRCVVLTSEAALMERALATVPELARRKRFSIDVLGLTAYVHLLERVPVSG
jgi:23S rRNA G2445 N2-methylase RlmL